ncbi:MAG: DNA-binding protein [Acidobacteriota bacterium]|nr:DNA-binding protein [Acidobacteriota bacterium]
MKTALAIVALMVLGACNTTTNQPATPCASTHRGCETRGFAIRLKPGDDLRRTLEEFTARRQLRAAYVATCAGSLKVAAVRFADQEGATTLTGPFEIVSVTGTLSTDGPHLHISVSDASGRTFGGHLAEGSLVYTTAEVVIVELVGARFRREIDPATSYKELAVE